jgi:hypothetical protein
MEKICEKEQSNFKRLRNYLLARGYGLGDADPLPILLAGQRGDEDWATCQKSVDDTLVTTCFNQCATISDPVSAAACNNACPVPDACQRVRNCNSLGFLPF